MDTLSAAGERIRCLVARCRPVLPARLQHRDLEWPRPVILAVTVDGHHHGRRSQDWAIPGTSMGVDVVEVVDLTEGAHVERDTFW